MERLLMLGLNHSTAPLALRERLAFNPEQRRDALLALREKFPGCEAVLLSTCNRVELYLARELHGHPRPEQMAEFLGDLRHVASSEFRSSLYEQAQRDVVHHLFSVAGSLDSMVIGETQILG